MYISVFNQVEWILVGRLIDRCLLHVTFQTFPVTYTLLPETWITRDNHQALVSIQSHLITSGVSQANMSYQRKPPSISIYIYLVNFLTSFISWWYLNDNSNPSSFKSIISLFLSGSFICYNFYKIIRLPYFCRMKMGHNDLLTVYLDRAF